MRTARWPLLAVIAFATGVGAAQAPTPPPAAAPNGAPASSLLWNARERTAAGLARLDAGDAVGAAGAFDTAWQLEPEHPLAAFNAGTGRLLAGRPDALPALEAAARAVLDASERGENLSELAPDAFFNLGNARLGAGDAAGAVEAYAETLRRAPRREDAKRNLELALRALEQQQSQGDSGRDQDPRNESQGGRGSETGSGEGDPKQGEKTSREGEDESRSEGEPRDGAESEPQPGDERGDASNGAGDSDPSTSAPPSPPSTESLSSSSLPSSSTEEPSSSLNDPSTSGAAAPAGSRRRERLPGFVDQEEMTADEAAALLDAVEDLERQQRRQRALERARRRAEVEKDW